MSEFDREKAIGTSDIKRVNVIADTQSSFILVIMPMKISLNNKLLFKY